MDDVEDDGGGNLLTRVALLEAKVKVIVLALEGMIALVAAALLGYFFGR